SDDAMISVLEDHADDPTQQELKAFIDALTEDEQVDLVALTWLGRGDGTIEDWDDLREEAQRLHNNRTAAYLLGKPMLGDHLEEGWAQFGHRCEDFYRLPLSYRANRGAAAAVLLLHLIHVKEPGVLARENLDGIVISPSIGNCNASR